MKIQYLYLWYIVAVIIAFLILWHRSLGGMPVGVALLIASVVGIVVGLILINYFREDDMTVDEERLLNGFVTLMIVVPVIALAWVILGGEYKQYWHKGTKAERSGSCFTETVILCDSVDQDCSLVSHDQECPDSHVHVRFA